MAAMHGMDFAQRAKLADSIPPLFGPRRERRDPDVFHWRRGRTGSVTRMELDCDAWRHQREAEDFEFRLSGPDTAPIKGVVTVTISAAYVSTPLSIRLPVRIGFEPNRLDATATAMVEAFERAALKFPNGLSEPED